MAIDPDVQVLLDAINASLAALDGRIRDLELPDEPPPTGGALLSSAAWFDVDGGTLTDGETARPGLVEGSWATGEAPDAAGVTFLVDGVVNRTDATADPYQAHPAFTLAGQTIRAEWSNASGDWYSETVPLP